MMIPIETWASKNFGVPVSKQTLIRYGKSGMISPAPFKFAGKYVVDEDAVYKKPEKLDTIKHDDPVLMRIINNATS